MNQATKAQGPCFNLGLDIVQKKDPHNVEIAQSQLEELTEDVMNMNINKDEHKEDTSLMEPLMDLVP